MEVRLRPCPGSWKECSCEHWGSCVFKWVFSASWGIYPGVELLDPYGRSVFHFLRSYLTVFLSGYTNFHTTNSVQGFLFPYSHPLSPTSEHQLCLGSCARHWGCSIGYTERDPCHCETWRPRSICSIITPPPPSVPTEEALSFCSSFPSWAFWLFQRA